MASKKKQDAQQAIKLVRERANEQKIDAKKWVSWVFRRVVVSTAGAHVNTDYIPNQQATNLRPDFLVLIYPVISMIETLARKGSKDLLLGTSPTPENVRLFSNEQQVTSQTSPTWLTHTGDDTVVPVDNSIQFYQALIRNKVPDEWMQPLFAWMKKNGWLN